MASPQSQHSTPLASPSHPPTPALTARDYTILSYILLCIKGADLSRLQFDWDALAQRMNMSNPRSASNAWLAIKKKISSATSSSPPKLTANDNRFLVNAVCCTKRSLDVDYPALAAKCRMGNPRSASNAWAAIKKKIAAASVDPPPAAAAAAAAADDESPAAGGAKKKAVVRVGTPKARSKAIARKRAQDRTEAEAVASPSSRPLAFKVGKQQENGVPGEKYAEDLEHQQQFFKPDPESERPGLPGSSNLSAVGETSYDMVEDHLMVKMETFDDEC